MPAPKPRGGKRPGAGAPKGNMNALKSGRYSKQMKALRLALQAMPATSDVVRRFDAAGSGKRAMLARALQHYAELLVAEPLVISNIVDLLEQSTKTTQNDPTQTHETRVFKKTNGQSNASRSGASATLSQGSASKGERSSPIREVSDAS